jgi:hypothetical protein
LRGDPLAESSRNCIDNQFLHTPFGRFANVSAPELVEETGAHGRVGSILRIDMHLNSDPGRRLGKADFRALVLVE